MRVHGVWSVGLVLSVGAVGFGVLVWQFWKRYGKNSALLWTFLLKDAVVQSFAKARRRLNQELYALPWIAVVGAFPIRTLRLPWMRKPWTADAPSLQWTVFEGAVLLHMLDLNLSVWTRVLKLCAWHRSRKPLDGVLLAISASELLNAELLDQKICAFYAFFESVPSAVRSSLPCTVWITECETLRGFVALGSALQEKPQTVVGCAASGLDDGFFESVRQRCRFLQSEVFSKPCDAAVADALLEFPLQARGLEIPLQKLFQSLFFETPSYKAPAFKGLFFTMNLAGTASALVRKNDFESVADALPFFASDAFVQNVCVSHETPARVSFLHGRSGKGLVFCATLATVLNLTSISKKLTHAQQQNTQHLQAFVEGFVQSDGQKMAKALCGFEPHKPLWNVPLSWILADDRTSTALFEMLGRFLRAELLKKPNRFFQPPPQPKEPNASVFQNPLFTTLQTGLEETAVWTAQAERYNLLNHGAQLRILAETVPGVSISLLAQNELKIQGVPIDIKAVLKNVEDKARACHQRFINFLTDPHGFLKPFAHLQTLCASWVRGEPFSMRDVQNTGRALAQSLFLLNASECSFLHAGTLNETPYDGLPWGLFEDGSALQNAGNAAARKAQTFLLSLSVPTLGFLFEKTDVGVAPTAGLLALKNRLNNVLCGPFAAQEDAQVFGAFVAKRAGFCLVWNAQALNKTLDLLNRFQALAQRSIGDFWGEKLRAAAQAHVSTLFLQRLTAAQTWVSAVNARWMGEAPELQNLASVGSVLCEIIDRARALGLAEGNWLEALKTYAHSVLESVSSMAEAQGFFVPSSGLYGAPFSVRLTQPAALSAFPVASMDDLKAYVKNESQILQTFAKTKAAPVLEVLNALSVKSPLATLWNDVLSNPKAFAALENFIGNERGALSLREAAALPALFENPSSFFQTVRARIDACFKKSVRQETQFVLDRALPALRETFNTRLKGRFPFTKNLNAFDADPEDVRIFIEQWDASGLFELPMGAGGRDDAWIQTWKALSVFLKKGLGAGAPTTVALRPWPAKERNAQVVVFWETAFGNQSFEARDQKGAFSWCVGDEVTAHVRLANSAGVVPVGSQNLDVFWRFNGPWALLRLIRTLGAGGTALRFEVPLLQGAQRIQPLVLWLDLKGVPSLEGFLRE